jgi:uracil-DNA glycosylase
MTTLNIFPYHWNWDDNGWDEEGRRASIIRIWGWNEKNEGVSIIVDDFPIPIFVELPETDCNHIFIPWTDERIDDLIKYITNFHKKWIQPVGIFAEEHKPLYDNRFYLDDEKKLQVYAKKYLKLYFKSQTAIDKYVKDLFTQPVEIPGLGKVWLKAYSHKKKLSPAMKLMTVQKLPSSNWIQAKGTAISSYKRLSNKKHEYKVSYKNLMAHPKGESLPIVSPLVCSFDIEAYSSDSSRMPDPEHLEDVILQIGCVFAKKGTITKKVCLSLGAPVKPPILEHGESEDFILQTFKSEKDLLLGFTKLICSEDPEVLIGYNIFGFDIKYMQKRAEILQIAEDFSKLGCIKNLACKPSQMEWESSARGKISFYYYDLQGRIFIDVLPMVQACDKQPSYRLEYIASVHLKTNKDPIKPKDIFRSWKDKDYELMWRICHYCCQDCVVTYLLYEKFMFWLGLTESATVNKVPIFSMVVQGQQIKAYAQVFDYCYHNDIVCNTPADTIERPVKSPYKGAFVEEPLSGLYNMILPFDFASLYPNIIIAYNVDFSTYVQKDQLDSIPADMYETFKGSDHVNCIHDPNYKEPKQRFKKDGTPIVAKKKKIICADYTHVYVKNDHRKGVIPTIISDLLAARKKVRKVIESQEDKIHYIEEEIAKLDPLSHDYKQQKEILETLKEVNQVLDKRQLAYKVNANSMYGMYGAETGYLPFFCGAETVTFVGRRSILAASDRLQRVHGGQVIYNDTDSAYTYFPHLVNSSVKEIWDFSSNVVKDIMTIFRSPMKLEFEGKIYPNFLILTKKRYIAQTVDEWGKLKDKMTIRGLPLVRREYCKNMTVIYEKVIRYIFNNIKEITAHKEVHLIAEEEKANKIKADFNKHFQAVLCMIHENFVNACSLQCVNPKDATNKYIDWTIFKGLNKEKYEGTVAHAVVADKIRARGTPVSQNSRIEMVYICKPDLTFDKNLKAAEIVEDLTYFKERSDRLRIDYLQYFKSQFINNFDVLLQVVFGKEKMCTEMFQTLVAKNHSCKKIRELSSCVVEIDESEFDEKEFKRFSIMQQRIQTSKIALLEGQTLETIQEEKIAIKEVYQPLYQELLEGVKPGWNLRVTNDILKEINASYQTTTCYPVKEWIFRCFTYFSILETKVVLIGQDPYPSGKWRPSNALDSNSKKCYVPNAVGLSFSVPADLSPPPSLQNMFKELQRDCGTERNDGDLTDWAEQGVLLLNSALTCEAEKSNSHKKLWQGFATEVIQTISKTCDHVVFILLGNEAIGKAIYVDEKKHCIIKAGHPSTLNRQGTYQDCKMYSKTNAYLKEHGKEEIRW